MELKNIKKGIFIMFLLLGIKSYSQTDVIEIDSISMSASKVMPYNKAFTIKLAIDAEDVNSIYFVKKHNHYNLSRSIEHYINSGGGVYTPPVIPQNYYYVKKVAKKNYLFLNFDDDFKLEPSASYYVIIVQKKLGTAVLGFFDNYYLSQHGPGAPNPALLTTALQSLDEFEASMRKIFGNLVFGYFTRAAYVLSPAAFDASFNTNILAEYNAYNGAKTTYDATILANSALMVAAPPIFDNLALKQISVDATINKDAVTYLIGKDGINNSIASDINSTVLQPNVQSVLNGAISLDCIYCNPVNINSTVQTDLNKRIANIESSINLLNNIKRVLNMMQGVSTVSAATAASITNLMGWIGHLQAAKTELKNLLRLRKAIEARITNDIYAGFNFNLASMASGNSYLNFETRNKVLLTPDFGVVTSAFSNKGKDLEYGIVPYLGFHINLMAVDKDLPFKSYKKNWKQYCSIMVGWSLVNMQKENERANFFEKSSLLTGVGLRLSNVIRITGGTQWLFDLRKDSNNVESRKLYGTPFIGLSFDLNVKQYLNGFADILSGIGKTKPSAPIATQTATTTSNQ
ncbi:hypothetical protein [Flavobacterium sp. 25HG05S-40]|uniref:hypothetical protein n=1 Tax=Flavobacterium sp. 25HG05S-40 TaxID=3458682 RepID=UPI004043AFB7